VRISNPTRVLLFSTGSGPCKLQFISPNVTPGTYPVVVYRSLCIFSSLNDILVFLFVF
jgi:hypothetical protein